MEPGAPFPAPRSRAQRLQAGLVPWGRVTGWSHGLALLVLAGVTLWLWRGLAHGGYPWGTDSLGHVSKVWDLARHWRRGETADWSWRWYAGYQPFLFYPPLSYVLPTLVYLVTGHLAASFKGAEVLAALAAAAGQYVLGMVLLGDRRRGADAAAVIAASTGGLVLALDPAFRSFAALKGEYADFWGFALTPWAMAAGIRWVRWGGRERLASYVLALAVLFYVHGHWAAMAAAGLLVFAPLYWWCADAARAEPPQPRLRRLVVRLVELAAADALFVLLAAAWALPFFHYAAAVGNPGTVDYWTGDGFSADLAQIFGRSGSSPWVSADYVGLSLLAGAVVAFAGRRRAAAAGLTGAAVLGLVVVLGGHTPLYRYLPVLNLIFPERGTGVLVVSLAGLCALGVHALLEGDVFARWCLSPRISGRRWRREQARLPLTARGLGAVAVLTLVGLWLWDLAPLGMPAKAVPLPGSLVAVNRWLADHPPPPGARVAFVGPQSAAYAFSPALSGLPVLNGYLIQGSRLADQSSYALSFWLGQDRLGTVQRLLSRWDVGYLVLDTPQRFCGQPLAAVLAEGGGWRLVRRVGPYAVLAAAHPPGLAQPAPGEVLVLGQGGRVVRQELRDLDGMGFVLQPSSFLGRAPAGALAPFAAVWLASPAHPILDGARARLLGYARRGGTLVLDADGWQGERHSLGGVAWRDQHLHGRERLLRTGGGALPFTAHWRTDGWSGVTYRGELRPWLTLPHHGVVAGWRSLGRGRLVALGLNLVFHAAYFHSRREDAFLRERLGRLLRPGASVRVGELVRGSDGLALSVPVSGPGWLELAMGWTPWWHAALDGRRVPTYSSFGGATVLFVPPGAHRLTLSFGGTAWERLSWGLSGLGLAALLLGWWWPRRRSARCALPLSERAAAGLAAAELMVGWVCFLGGGVLGAYLGRGYPPLQWTGFVLLGLYGGLFARNGLWLALRGFWWRGPSPGDGEPPTIGLLIPARNEARLIQRTLQRLNFLDYPRDRLRAVIIADGKEEAERERRAQELEQALADFLHSHRRRSHLPSDREGLSLFLQQLFGETVDANVLPLYDAVGRRRAHWFSLEEAARRCAWTYRPGQRRPVRAQLRSELRRHGFSLQAYRLLAGHSPLELLPRLSAPRLRGLLRAHLGRGEVARVLPTTAEVAARHAPPWVTVSTVPACYGGGCPTAGCPGPAVCSHGVRREPSSKGRALNWGMGMLGRVDLIGVFDADARAERGVLRRVSDFWRATPAERRWCFFRQGPVFQVRNFYRLGLVEKPVALYQAMTHDAYYPVWLALFPFPGGTNMFFTPALAAGVGGFAGGALSEDLDFGLRVWERYRVKPAFLPATASEQTPATLPAMLRQRQRWAFGYLDGLSFAGRRRWWGLVALMVLEGPFQWVIGFAMFVTGVGGFALMLSHLLLMQGRVPLLDVVGAVANLPFLVFTLTMAVLYFDWMDLRQRPGDLGGQLADGGRVLAHVPVLFLMMWPWVTALFTYRRRRGRLGWHKTERTAE